MSSEDESGSEASAGDVGSNMTIDEAYQMYATEHGGQFPITQKQFLSYINVGRGGGRWSLKFADVRSYWDQREPVATAVPKHLDVVNKGQYGDESGNYQGGDDDDDDEDAGGAPSAYGGGAAVEDDEDEDDEPAVQEDDEDDEDDEDEPDDEEPEPEPVPAEPEPEPEVEDDEDDDDDDEDDEDEDSD